MTVRAFQLLAMIMTFGTAGHGAFGLQTVPERTLPRMPSAPAMPSTQSAEQLVKIKAMADVPQVTPGQKFHLAFVFDIEPRWHIYWKNPGSSGGPTSIRVTGPSDFTIGQTLFPRPQAFESEDGATYGYSNKTVLFVEVTAPQHATPSVATFNARINYMVCNEVCLVGRATQMVTVPVGETDRRLPSATPIDPAVKQFRSRLPQPIASVEGSSAQFDGANLIIKLPAGGHNAAEFFPYEVPGVTYGSPSIRKEAEAIILTVPVTVRPNDSTGEPMTIAGTVGMGKQQTDPAYDVEISLNEQGHPQPPVLIQN